MTWPSMTTLYMSSAKKQKVQINSVVDKQTRRDK